MSSKVLRRSVNSRNICTSHSVRRTTDQDSSEAKCVCVCVSNWPESFLESHTAASHRRHHSLCLIGSWPRTWKQVKDSDEKADRGWRRAESGGSYWTMSGLVSKMKGRSSWVEMAWCLARDFRTRPLSPGSLLSFISSTSHLPVHNRHLSTIQYDGICRTSETCVYVPSYLAISSSASSFLALDTTQLKHRSVNEKPELIYQTHL